MVISAEKFSKGEFTEKIKRTDTLEINSLADSLNAMAKQLDEKIKMITIQKNENDAILSSMSEGLIATNQLNKIIKINNQFKNLFDIVDGDQGTDIRSVIKNDDFLEFYKRLVNQNKSQKIEATIDSINKKTILCSGTMLKNQYGNFIRSESKNAASGLGKKIKVNLSKIALSITLVAVYSIPIFAVAINETPFATLIVGFISATFISFLLSNIIITIF